MNIIKEITIFFTKYFSFSFDASDLNDEHEVNYIG